jgi:transposase-like protein
MQNYKLSIFLFTYEFGRYPIPLTTLTYSVLLHYDMSTASSDSTLYRCEVCNKTFNSQDEIERHNKETHIETAGQKE